MQRFMLIILLLLTLLATSSASAATTSEAFTRQRFVGFGMQPVATGNQRLRATLGEPFVAVTGSGSMHVCTGFWCGWPFMDQIMLPIIMRI